MAIERGPLIEIIASVAVVGAFAVLLIWIGTQFNRENLDPDGGLALVGAITLFILVMAVMGYGLARMTDND